VIRPSLCVPLTLVLPSPSGLNQIPLILSDPRWTRETFYHEEVLEGVTKLNPPELFGPLYDSLRTGAAAAAAAAGETLPPFPECPGADADIFTWDAAICPVLETLQHMDTRARQKGIPLWQRRAFFYLERLRGV